MKVHGESHIGWQIFRSRFLLPRVLALISDYTNIQRVPSVSLVPCFSEKVANKTCILLVLQRNQAVLKYSVTNITNDHHQLAMWLYWYYPVQNPGCGMQPDRRSQT